MTTYLGKSCSFGLPRVPFVNCRRFMYLVISLLVYRAGCGIQLYQFLIIAYLFTSFNQSIIKKNRILYTSPNFPCQNGDYLVCIFVLTEAINIPFFIPEAKKR